MATTLTISDRHMAYLADLVRQRPGVTRHRMGLAIFELGLECIQEEPERLDVRLLAMVDQGQKRRRAE